MDRAGQSGCKGCQRPLKRQRIEPGGLGKLAHVRDLVVIAAQGNVEPVSFIFQLAAQEVAFLIAHVAVQPGIVAIAVAIMEIIDDTRGQALCQRHVQNGFDIPIGIVADFALQAAFQPIDRILGQNVDRAARRVAPKQRALRTTQHFETLEIVQIGQALRRPCDINAVDIGRDRRIVGDQRLEIALAADRHECEAGRRGRAGRYDDAGRDTLHVLHADDLRALNRDIAQCRDGQRGGLQAFLGPPRGDDDILNAAELFLRRFLWCDLPPRGLSHRDRQARQHRRHHQFGRYHHSLPHIFIDCGQATFRWDDNLP